MKNEAQLRARKAVDVIRRESLTIMATWNGNLYKRCLEGVAEFERLRPRVKPATAPARYCSLIGQEAAGQFAAASLDNVLTVLIGETTDHKWQYDIVTDVPGVCFGSPADDRWRAARKPRKLLWAASPSWGPRYSRPTTMSPRILGKLPRVLTIQRRRLFRRCASLPVYISLESLAGSRTVAPVFPGAAPGRSSKTVDLTSPA